MKRPIAMKCNQEQFNSLKHKLENYRTDYVNDFSVNTYLTNYLQHGNQIGTCTEFFAKNNIERHELHEEWNKKVFLEACGIEAEKTYSITESQIKELCSPSFRDNQERLKEMFPEAFESEVKLEVGKWYKSLDHPKWMFCVTEIIEKAKRVKGFGFGADGLWMENISDETWEFYEFERCPEATEQEVFEALKSHSLKIGIKEGVVVDRTFDKDLGIELIKNECFPSDPEWYFDFKNNYLEYHGFVVYFKGQWAEVYQKQNNN